MCLQSNRALLFKGDLLHGVIPSHHVAGQDQDQHQDVDGPGADSVRTTLMIGFWRDRPEVGNVDGVLGPNMRGVYSSNGEASWMKKCSLEVDNHDPNPYTYPDLWQ